MSEVPLPVRQTESARLADDELLAVLSIMAEDNETITVRAVARRMAKLSHASAITRDHWRRGTVERAVAEQRRLRQLAERSDKESRTNIANRLQVQMAKSASLEMERNLVLGGMLAAIQAISEMGGMPAWLKFFEHTQPALDSLRKLGVAPIAEIHELPKTGAARPLKSRGR